MTMEKLLTVSEAAEILAVSTATIYKLVEEAETMPRISRWKEKRDFVNLAPATSIKRKIRILPSALLQ